MEGLSDAFLDVISHHTAGSPIDETIKWTNLSRPAIAQKLEEQGFKISVTVVDQLLAKHDFRPRQAFKVEAGKKNIPQRDEQFKKIEEAFLANQNERNTGVTLLNLPFGDLWNVPSGSSATAELLKRAGFDYKWKSNKSEGNQKISFEENPPDQ